MLVCVQINAQNIANSYLNVSGWTGQMKMTIVESEPGSGVTYTTIAEGPATVMNPNPKTPMSLVWPLATLNTNQVPITPDPNSPTFIQDIQNANKANKEVLDAYLQWDADITYTYESKMNQFPVDVRDVNCTYQGRKKSELLISIVPDENNQYWFTIKGVASPVYDAIECSGSIAGEAFTDKNDCLITRFYIILQRELLVPSLMP
jgi:hypothetical protein